MLVDWPDRRESAKNTSADMAIANDNCADSQHESSADADFAIDNIMVQAALRIFAEHGLNAGCHAYGQAKLCFWNGDHDGQQWWMEISRLLDHKVTSTLNEQVG